MSRRTALVLAVTALMSLPGLYAASAQVLERPRAREGIVPQASPELRLTDGAIVEGPPPLRLQQELPGRYQVQAAASAGGPTRLALVDTHTGQCWIHEGRGWQNLGSPVKQE